MNENDGKARKTRKARKARKDDLDLEDVLNDARALLTGKLQLDDFPVAPEPEPAPAPEPEPKLHQYLEVLNRTPVNFDDGDGLGDVVNTNDGLSDSIPLSVVRGVMPLRVRREIMAMPVWHLMMAFTRADAVASLDEHPDVIVMSPVSHITAMCSMAFIGYILYTRYPVQYAQWNGRGTPLQYFWGLE